MFPAIRTTRKSERTSVNASQRNNCGKDAWLKPVNLLSISICQQLHQITDLCLQMIDN